MYVRATLSATNSERSSTRAAAASVRDAWRRISASRPPLSNTSWSTIRSPPIGHNTSSAMPMSRRVGIAQVADPGRGFDRNARVPKALRLNPLFLGGHAVRDRLPDFGIGVKRGLYGVAQFDCISR